MQPEEIQSIVEEVVRRVQERLGQGGASIQPTSQEPIAGQPGYKPAACGLAHGVAARPPVGAESGRSAIESGYGSPVAAGATGGLGAASGSAGPALLVDAGACRLGSHRSESGAPPEPGACGDVASYLDHTLLKPDATDEQVRQLCEEAKRFRFATVCVNSAFVPLCASLLRGSGVLVCSVVGFPLGAMSTESKAFETRQAIAEGAEEIDMVIPVGKLQQGDFGYAFRDIEAVVKAAHGIPVKVILETALLTDEQKVIGCALSKAAGAHFVKTSTGFSSGGATAADVALMRRIVGPEMGVKASGGIRDCPTAFEMIAAGANRIGASASVKIVTQSR